MVDKINKEKITHEKEEILKELDHNTNPIEQEVLRKTFLDLNRQLIPKIDFTKLVIPILIWRNMPAAVKPFGIKKLFFFGCVAIAGIYSYCNFSGLEERTSHKERNFNLDKEFDKKTKI